MDDKAVAEQKQQECGGILGQWMTSRHSEGGLADDFDACTVGGFSRLTEGNPQGHALELDVISNGQP